MSLCGGHAASLGGNAWQLVGGSGAGYEEAFVHERRTAVMNFFPEICLPLNMRGQGFFGEIVHCEGLICHNLQILLFSAKTIVYHNLV